MKSHLYDTQLGEPAIRLWDLDENSTRYDRARAAPSDSEMQHVWTVWSVFFFVFATFNTVVFLGVLSSKVTRRKPFNLYLIFLMIPDVIYTGFCAIQCAILAAQNGYNSAAFCNWQSFYIIFGLTANSWLNGLIAWELNKLLAQSNRRQRYFPPTLTQVTQRSGLVYLYAAVIAGMGCVVYPWWPVPKTDTQNGLVCLPMDFDMTSTILFWTLYFPIMSALPLGYCVYILWDVHRKGILPPGGKRRELTIYFYRITAVFLFMWLPGVFVFYVLSGVSIYFIYISAIWSHSQGAVAAGVALMKTDIHQAVKDFVTCRWLKAGNNHGDVHGDDVTESRTASRQHDQGVAMVDQRPSTGFFQPGLSVALGQSLAFSLRGARERPGSSNLSGFLVEPFDQSNHTINPTSGHSRSCCFDQSNHTIGHHTSRSFDALKDIAEKDVDIEMEEGSLGSSSSSSSSFKGEHENEETTNHDSMDVDAGSTDRKEQERGEK